MIVKCDIYYAISFENENELKLIQKNLYKLGLIVLEIPCIILKTIFKKKSWCVT